MPGQQTASERRNFARVAFSTAARLAGDHGAWKCALLDISLKGALIATPMRWPGKSGDKFVLEVPLDANQHVIRMEVSVKHTDPQRTGLHCRHIDLDSITDLKRLLELNLGDPELIHRELGQLG